MKRILCILPLLFLDAPSSAAAAPSSGTNIVNMTISGNPGGAGNVSVSSKLPRIRVDVANKGFVDAAGQRFTPCGVSYYRPGTGWAPQLWKQFDAEATRLDFQRMKRMGMNVARVFVTFGSFYTEPEQLDASGLATFDRMLDLADEAGIYLHPTGPEHWEGMPPWTQSLGGVFDNFANEACLKALEDFWRMFAGRYRGRSTIWAYDLRNEPTTAWDTPQSRVKWDAWRTARQQPIVPVPDKKDAPSAILADYQRFRESLAEGWVARQSQAIRAADPQALVTVGLLQWSVPAQPVTADQYTGFRPEIIARHLDFLELHFYPLAKGVYRYEDQDAEDANLAVVECMTRECAKPGKPVVIAEFGWYGGGPLDPGGKPADEEQQARWCRRLVEVTAPMACGWINWGLYDMPEAKDVSRLTGLITSAGTDKAWGRAFGPLVKGLPAARALPARPDLPWESCTMDGEAMTRFQADYLAAFLALPVKKDSPVAALMAVPVLAEDTGAIQMNLFAQKYTGQRTDFTGNVGFEFTPAEALSVTALGRSVSGTALQRAHAVTLWDTVTEKPLAQVSISPASRVDAHGFAFEQLAKPLTLEKDRCYRLTSGEEAAGDPMMNIGDIRAHRAVVDIGPGVFAVGDAYPKQTYGREGQGYGLPTFYFDTTGLATELLKTGPRPPTPFLRELATGYLLQCSFMSPRPYCWGDDKTVMLSGWEVDKSGGHYEYQPNCIYPAGFGFHSDWFKLVDTSSDGAITLKHKVARQTEGAVTLEFRFKLPAAMEGASWQLRDLEHAGVSVVIKGGNLCWETGDVLMPCETNRDYGVKIIADIDSKTATVLVDGEMKASGLPFVKPLESIDYVLVKTGDAATGEMFLNPVNLYKGYSVNETFVTCGVGKSPADWTVKEGSVQPFECASKPDIFSLKVTGQALRKIGSWKEMTVFECRFLLPDGVDGVGVNLGGVALERIAPYRANLWYMAKVVADPKSKTADVYINGKRLPEKIAFPKPEESIRFSGNVWVDDVQVYPWRDYPADYVPEPKPVVASHILGVQSCNLWREGTAYAGWDFVRPYADKRKPYLGWYDEGNPEVTDWEIKWQVEHGIGFEMHCWYRPNNAISHPIKDGVLDQGIIKGLFNARYSHLKKFAIMCTNEGACETNPQDWHENIIPYWIEYFFKDPRYMKIDGKPILSIYHLGNLVRMFGGDDGARQAIETLRDEVAKAGFPGVVVLMELRNADRSTMKQMKSIGVDYCYAYTWATPDVNIQRQNNIQQRDAGAAENFGVLPSISMGWDREPWGVREGGWVAPEDYQALLQWTRDEHMPSLPADSPGRRIVMLPNWNEFGEGHFLMPSALAGFGYVNAMREVFTSGAPHEDQVPTEAQKRRFTILYPNN